MKTSTLLATLRAHSALPLVFRAGSAAISSHYHLTEVKRVAYETMDCGAQTHRWSETQFELWVPPLVGALPGRDHMPAAKFLAILDRVEKELPLDSDATTRVFVALGDAPAALYDIASIEAHDGRLHVELTADRTRCKAAERRVTALTGGCCGSGERSEGTACCGSDSPAKEPAACCV